MDKAFFHALCTPGETHTSHRQKFRLHLLGRKNLTALMQCKPNMISESAKQLADSFWKLSTEDRPRACALCVVETNRKTSRCICNRLIRHKSLIQARGPTILTVQRTQASSSKPTKTCIVQDQQKAFRRAGIFVYRDEPQGRQRSRPSDGKHRRFHAGDTSRCPKTTPSTSASLSSASSAHTDTQSTLAAIKQQKAVSSG